MRRTPTVLLSSGEVSGDAVGSGLARTLQKLSPGITLYGLGGSRMAASGVQIEIDTNRAGAVGISEVLFTLPTLFRALMRVRRRISVAPPDLAVLIGNDVFHVLLARWLRRKGIRTVSYFPPQVWVWRSLAPWISRSFDAILTCFPEEQAVYQRCGANAIFVGHYLRDYLSPTSPETKGAALRRWGFPPECKVIGLLPGSRPHEIRQLAPVLLEAAAALSLQDTRLAFILPAAEPCYEEALKSRVQSLGLAGKVLVNDSGHEAMQACDLALVASGTATLEAALMSVPMIVLYRVSPVTMAVIRAASAFRLLKSDTVGLPNLLLGKRVVPELNQSRATAANLATLAWALLQDERRLSNMRRELEGIRALLGESGCLERAAQFILTQLAPSLTFSNAAEPDIQSYRAAPGEHAS
jgi:lipid-A-disaccharide synthase